MPLSQRKSTVHAGAQHRDAAVVVMFVQRVTRFMRWQYAWQVRKSRVGANTE